MSKNTNGCAAVKGAKKNTNTAARTWTAKQEAKAKRYYSAYAPEEKKSADRLAKKNGCAPWEIVAADLAAHRAINTGCAKKPAKRNAGSLPTWAEIEDIDTGKAARIERWRGHAAKIVPTYKTTVLDAVSNAAHLSPVEYVIAYLSEMRGLAGHHAEDDWMQKHNRVIDIAIETMHTRTRNHEERETVRSATFRLSTIGPCIRDDDFTAQELQTLAARFKRKGEWTLDAAIVRAAKAGLASGNA